MTSGVYQILNTVNGKCYVGSSASIEKRWRTHRWGLETGRHHSKKLTNAAAKHGIGVFEFLVLQVCAPDQVLAAEEQWIHAKNATAEGYNTRFVPHSNAGIKFSDEAKAKMSASGRGRKHPPDTIARMRRAQSSRSADTLKRQSESQKGKPRPWLVGREVPKERCEKISAALTGRKLAPESIAKRQATRKAKDALDPSRLVRAPMTEEAKANVRAACTPEVRQQQWATRRANNAAKKAAAAMPIREHL